MLLLPPKNLNYPWLPVCDFLSLFSPSVNMWLSCAVKNEGAGKCGPVEGGESPTAASAASPGEGRKADRAVGRGEKEGGGHDKGPGGWA